jgi:hypothetical protein
VGVHLFVHSPILGNAVPICMTSDKLKRHQHDGFHPASFCSAGLSTQAVHMPKSFFHYRPSSQLSAPWNTTGRASERSHQWIGISAVGIAIFSAIALLLTGLLVQIFVMHKFYFTSHALVTSAALGPVIAIAHVSSVAVSATVPFVLSISAYHLAHEWLSASQEGNDNRPTPFQ